MKRITILPAIFACALLLAGCEIKKPDPDPEESLRLLAASGETVQEAEAPAPAATEKPPVYLTAGYQKPGAHGTAYTLPETALFSNGAFSFTVTGMQKTAEGDHALTVSWKNSGAEPLMIMFDDVIASGYAMDPFFAALAEPFSSGEGVALFLKEQTEPLGLDFIDSLSFTLSVCPEDRLFTEYLAKEPCVLRPTGLEEQAVLVPAIPHQSAEEQFLGADGLVFVIEGPDKSYEASEDYALVLGVFLENGSGEALTFSLDGVTINGAALDPYWAERLPAGARALSRVYFTREDYEKNGVTGFDAMEFVLRVTDESYNTVKEISGTYRQQG